jgi:DNA-binding transcriptional LysR family regulator
MSNANVPKFDAYSVRLFVAAAQEGSIARGAAREHIAPSALSRRIAELEHELGTPLFIRSARGIELTEAGKCVLEHGLRIEEDQRNLIRRIWSGSGKIVGTVRLYANASSIVGFLPERLKAYKVAHPAVDIALHEQRSWEVIRACMDNRADLGVAVATAVPKSLESWHFAADPLLVLLPLQHVLAAETRLKFKAVVECGLVGIQAGGALDQLLHERAEAARINLKPSVSVNSFDAACRMVEAGLGAAIVPTSAAAAYAGTSGFLRCALDEPWANRELRLYASRKAPHLPAVHALLEALKG